MGKTVKEKSKLINIQKAVDSKKAKKETQRVIDALIEFRIKNGVKDAKGSKIFLNTENKTKSDRMSWLENQRIENLITPKEIPIIPTVEEMMEKIDESNLSVEDLMLMKENLRNQRIKELNKIIY